MATIEFENVTKRYGADVPAVDQLTLEVAEGEFVILVGPSGCGKTTALRMTAGLEELTSGAIRLDGEIVNDRPPADRDVAMVFQSYALYPHMTVHDNIAFPLRQKRMKRQERGERVREVSRLLALEPLLERRPRELSGGQRQRVAIGRALVRHPRAFLMDEPLSNLDAKLRVQMRAELLSLHRRVGVTTLYVTHDQTEAMTLGDRVVVLADGVVQQVDAPERLYRRPCNTFVASFIGSPGMNFLAGTLSRGSLALGRHQVELPKETLLALSRVDGDVIVGLRPEDAKPVAAATDPGLDAEVVIAEQLGPEVLAYIRVDGVDPAPGASAAAPGGDESVELRDTIVVRLGGDVAAERGQRLRFSFDPVALSLFDPASGRSLLAR